jgi:hypothetical protein
MSQSMGIREYRNVTLFEQGADLDPVGGVRVPQESQIDGSRKQGGNLRRGGQLAQAKFHLRIAAPVTLYGGWKIGKHDRATEAHRQCSFFSASQPPHLRKVVLNFFDCAPRAFGEKLAGEGQLYAPRGPIEEAVAEELFEPFDLLAERRLSDPQELCRLAEVQRFSHGEKVAKMTKLDLFIHTAII